MQRHALLLSGHTRSLQINLNSLLAIKRALACDVFIHTWTSSDMAEPTWRKPEDYGSSGGAVSHLIGELSALALEIEDSNEAKVRQWHRAAADDRITGAHYMTYGICRVHELFRVHCERSGARYQTVTRYRFDLACLDQAALARDVETIAPGVLTVARHNWGESLGCVFDGMFAARTEDFARLAAAMQREFHSAFKQLTASERFIPELLIANIARQEGLRIRFTETRVAIVRKDGSHEQTFGELRRGALQRARSLSTAYVVCEKVDRAERARSTTCRAWREANSWFVRIAVALSYPAFRALKASVTRTDAA